MPVETSIQTAAATYGRKIAAQVVARVYQEKRKRPILAAVIRDEQITQLAAEVSDTVKAAFMAGVLAAQQPAGPGGQSETNTLKFDEQRHFWFESASVAGQEQALKADLYTLACAHCGFTVRQHRERDLACPLNAAAPAITAPGGVQ